MLNPDEHVLLVAKQSRKEPEVDLAKGFTLGVAKSSGLKIILI